MNLKPTIELTRYYFRWAKSADLDCVALAPAH
jgi:hypothetical protein